VNLIQRSIMPIYKLMYTLDLCMHVHLLEVGNKTRLLDAYLVIIGILLQFQSTRESRRTRLIS
jgi:hypothetical protein